MNTKVFLRKNRNWVRLIMRVEGVSMSNRVEDGDLVLFSRTDKTYYPDDVVLFERDNETHVSSILASPGDIVTIDDVGRLYVNGAQVSDRVVYNLNEGETPTISFPFRVPNGSYFLLNGNLEAMDDSRSFGAIYAKDIKGKIVTILRTRSI